MKLILKVAGTELRSLFYSPIAWFLLIVFWIQSGTTFFSLMNMVAGQIEVSGTKQEFYYSITNWVFLSMQGLFNSVMSDLYLYIPLLTMSLMSREISSGTMKLLYSSPVKMYEIVFGKYLAMMAYSLLLVLVLGGFMLSGITNIHNADIGMLLSALLGFYLLLCAYSAIGLFMSCLTGYQVVAAVSTFVMIGILSYIGTMWQEISFVRELTFYLSIRGRTMKMLGGLITTKDVLYFIIIIYIFLGFSILRLKAGMESKPFGIRAARYISVVALGLLIGYISSITSFVGYWDTTSDKANTLTPRVQQLVKNLGDEPLEVTAYANLLDQYYYLGSQTSYNQNRARWEPYLRFKDNIVLNTVRYYDSIPADRMRKSFEGKTLEEIGKQYARSMRTDLKHFLSPGQIRKKIDLSKENNRYVMQLKWKGRTTFLRVFNDLRVWPSETEVAAALQRLQQATLPRIAFVSSELERQVDKSGDRDYKTLVNFPSFRYSLINQGFDAISVSLDSDTIPSDVSALVIADPVVNFSTVATIKLQEYIHNGGNLLIAGEPGRQSILNPLLKEFGVQLNEGMVIRESKDDAPDFATAYVQKDASEFYKPLKYEMEDSLALNMPGVASLNYTANGPFTILPLASTDGDKTWNRIKPVDLETMIHARVTTSTTPTSFVQYAANVASKQVNKSEMPGTITFNATEGDVMGPLTTVFGMSRKINGKEQRIVISGDADFLSNKELGRPQHTANFLFGTSLFRWMSGGEFPVDTMRPEPLDKKLNTTLEELSIERIIYLWVFPALMFGLAAALLIRRKRK